MAARHILMAAGAAALLGATPAMAQPGWDRGGPPVTHVETVRDLAQICDPRRSGVPRLEAIAYCQGFITAAVQYHQLSRRGAPLFCVPGRGPSIAQSGVGFAAWARDNPARWNEPALDGLIRWAQSSFPCRGPAPRR